MLHWQASIVVAIIIVVTLIYRPALQWLDRKHIIIRNIVGFVVTGVPYSISTILLRLTSLSALLVFPVVGASAGLAVFFFLKFWTHSLWKVDEHTSFRKDFAQSMFWLAVSIYVGASAGSLRF